MPLGKGVCVVLQKQYISPPQKDQKRKKKDIAFKGLVVLFVTSFFFYTLIESSVAKSSRSAFLDFVVVFALVSVISREPHLEVIVSIFGSKSQPFWWCFWGIFRRLLFFWQTLKVLLL